MEDAFIRFSAQCLTFINRRVIILTMGIFYTVSGVPAVSGVWKVMVPHLPAATQIPQYHKTISNEVRTNEYKF